jgi:hypothetical protein
MSKQPDETSPEPGPAKLPSAASDNGSHAQEGPEVGVPGANEQPVAQSTGWKAQAAAGLSKLTGLVQILSNITTKYPFLNVVWFVVVVSLAVAISRLLGLDERTTFLSSAVAVMLFVVVVIYKVVTGLAKAKLTPQALVLSWAALILFLIFIALLMSSVFFGWPLKLQRWLDTQATIINYVAPPEAFTFTTGISADDSSLPDEIFGSAKDDIGMPRQWMRTLDAGAMNKLKVNNISDLKPFWLLTNKFTGDHRPFTAFVYAGTPEKVVISAFLLSPNGETKMVSLKRGPDPGTPGQYVFQVPESRAGNRLLVFLAMKSTSYEAIPGTRAFHIRSQPL